MGIYYLKLFVDCLEKYQKLNDAEFGRLIRAALIYIETGVEVKLTGREELLWDGMKLDIDRDNEKYTSVSTARKEAGAKGAAARWQTDSKNSKSHLPYGKNGYDKDKDKDKDKDYPTYPARDPEVSRAITFYQDEVGGTLNSTVAQDIVGFVGRLTADVVIEAIKRSLKNADGDWRYAKAILCEWERKGVKHAADIERLDGNRNGGRHARSTGNKNGTPAIGGKDKAAWGITTTEL